jgi:hypothetical protein
MKQNNYEASKQYLNKANGFKDFDLENRLYAQIKSLLRTIKTQQRTADIKTE